MDFGSIYHFLFETYVGIGILIGVSLVVCVSSTTRTNNQKRLPSLVILTGIAHFERFLLVKEISTTCIQRYTPLLNANAEESD